MMRAFNKEIIRSITQSIGRFAAIAIIAFLGAGFYAGLRMAAPDMRIAGDEFFDGTGLYDISVACSLGLDEESLDMLRGVEGVGAVMPAYTADAMVLAGEGSYAARIESFPDGAARASDTSDGVHARATADDYLNRLLLLEGAWPEKSDECVVGADAAAELCIALGDVITLEKGTSDLDETFADTAFRVTGFVNSPVYASSSQLGTTSLGTGSVELYLYVLPSAFAEDLPYSIAYVEVPGAAGAVWDSASYDDAVAAVRQRIDDIAGELGEERWQAVKDELHHEVAGLLQELSVSLDWADDIEQPEVYVLDRTKNAGAASLAADAEGIDQIALFLPFMFFLVAALVSLTSMTRMVDEERMVIGTHKALGYSGGRITSKYLIYGALASGIGSVLGVLTLGRLLPWFIMTSYAISYAVPVFPTPLDPAVTAKAIGFSVGITVAATWWAASASLRERPAALMLPRVPKAGKRIVLERIKPLWSRLSFSHKVTARNLLRYKRRFFMAVGGIAGCTALLVVGFGLRDAIGGIVSNQYNELVSYDAMVRMDEGISDADRGLVEDVLVSADVESYLEVDSFNMIAEGENGDMRIEVVVPAAPERLGEFVTLRDRETQAPVGVAGGRVALTEKAAETLGVSSGDELGLFDENAVGDKSGEARMFVVDGIAENYLGHYAYLTPDGYRAAFGALPAFDTVYVKLAPSVDPAAFSESLLSIGGVNTVSFVTAQIETYEDMLDVMDKLIVIIVLLSAALAFVVLYNLTNINIAERVREIATLKVLGFTKHEVRVYIFREIVIMALIGALIGCVLGVPLTSYIARAAETAQMMFGRTIEPASFVWSFVITMAFSAIVAFTMRGKLAKVDMVESLKSVE